MQTQKTVLVVDDDNIYRGLLKIVFERNGYTVLEAESGHDALTVAQSNVPNVIVLDVMLPDISCAKALRSLHADPATGRVPIVVLSNYSEPEKISEAITNGATNYVLKVDHTPREIFDLANKLVSEATKARTPATVSMV